MWSLLAAGSLLSTAREKYNFNPDWRLHVGDPVGAESPAFDDADWQKVTLPRAFNEDEAFRLPIDRHSDTISWWRKHFRIPDMSKAKKVFVEFEGVRQGADFYLNGHRLGLHENGVMAVGFDLTPFMKEGENVLAVRVDNDWRYHERATGETFQWSDRNFNANYGGLPKNVWLYTSGDIYQTLPLYSNLGTTGTYIYATDFDIKGRKAKITAETEVRNESKRPETLSCRVSITDCETGKTIKTFTGKKQTLEPGQTGVLSASARVADLNFWSWGYGYLYDVKTELVDSKGIAIDEVTTRTGFRKTEFGNGLTKLNDRPIMMHGYAQRTSNEWPAVGLSIPAWLSDYSNDLMVESGGNLVRWMHVTPWKQDVESCDRVGLIQAMPAGDAEKDRDGRKWEQRTELMRDAIIYNRNNPSILFYESGNRAVTPEHIAEMIAIRDKYDPYGGRAAGCREMLDVDASEYGGEMLYINRSAKHPMWAMEYCRDEALRKYWDAYSYPFHKQGEGPLYKGSPASEYNQNQDLFAVEMVRRWYDYWLERPGAGRRSSNGGAKIIFSDTNTHYRGAENYRRSGVTDPMRIPKDAFEVHKVMWDRTWVDNEGHRSHIIGHWNYPAGTKKPVYVVSTGSEVELLLNGESLGTGKRDYNWLFTFDDVEWQPGELIAISRDEQGREVSRSSLQTAGAPASLRLTAIENPEGFRADGADMALLQVEVVDAQGRRCPLDNRMVNFSIDGPAEWRGGIAQGPDNFILQTSLPVECGVNRALLRSTTEPGEIIVRATAWDLPEATLKLSTQEAPSLCGLSLYKPNETLKGRLGMGATPLTPSFKTRMEDIAVKAIEAGSNQSDAYLSRDDNEKSQWISDGNLSNAWITYIFEKPAEVADIVLKLSGWRKRTYPIEIYAGDRLVWKGWTPKGLGYIHLQPEKGVVSDRITIRQIGAMTEKDAFSMKELAGGPASDLDIRPAKEFQLAIVEAEFLEK